MWKGNLLPELWPHRVQNNPNNVIGIDASENEFKIKNIQAEYRPTLIYTVYSKSCASYIQKL